MLWSRILYLIGEYDVYVYKYAYPNSDSAAGFEIVHGNGSMVNCPTQNWQQGETGWVKLTTETGPLHFDEQTVSGKQHVSPVEIPDFTNGKWCVK